MKLLLLLLVLTMRLSAATWYSSPTATAGAGTLADPWNLQVALTNALIQPGDTLYLRDGIFTGHRQSKLNGLAPNYITVRSYPNEWALHTDGEFGGLASNVGATNPFVSSSITITNATGWLVLQVVMIGVEDMRLESVANQTNWTVTRGWNGTIATNHTAGDRVIPKGPLIDHSGTNTIFMEMGFTSVQATNRIVGIGTGWWVSPALNLDVGYGNKAINLIIYNTGHPAIGFWDQGDNGEINGCIVWGTGFYDTITTPGDFTRGTMAYCENITGHPYVKNNISFRNFTEGMQAYGTAAATKGFRFINNITMMNPNTFGIAVWNAEVPTEDNLVLTNYHGMDGEIFGYTSPSNITSSCIGNVLVYPPSSFFKNHISGTMSNNTYIFNGTFYGQVNPGLLQYEYPSYALTNSQWSWDRNTYYYTNQDQFIFALNTLDHSSGPKINFTNWQAQTMFDSNSTVTATIPTNIQTIKAFQLDYDVNRWHIAVVNTDTNTTNAALSLSSLGFNNGDGYTLRDAQLYTNIVTSGTFLGQSVNLPLNLTNYSPILGTLTHYTNMHSNTRVPGLFNAFVLTRTARGSDKKLVARVRLRR